MLMSTDHFRSQTGVRIKSAFGKAKSSSELIGLHKGLDDLHNGTYPKYTPQARWNHMMVLAGRCESYLDRKRAKGRDLAKPKHRCIDELSAQCLANMLTERAKSTDYGRKVTQYDNVMGAMPLGRNNPHHRAVKFELALGGKTGERINGQDLWTAAQRAGVQLTGNDSRDAYILRSWLKHKVRTGELNRDLYPPLEYADMQQRQQYLLTFDATTVWQGDAAFNTVDGFVEGEDKAGAFVISEGGEWYAKAGRVIGGYFHHSSFLSGAPVLCAGTICVDNGTLQYITNSSGHYAPKIADLWNACQQLVHSGLDWPALRKASVIAGDFEGKYGAQPSRYVFPFMMFYETRGAIPNPQNYDVFTDASVLYWQNPDAPRPDCVATRGARNLDGFPVVFPT